MKITSKIFALEYTKANPYIHVHVENDWYPQTTEYKAYIAGWTEAINQVRNVMANDVPWDDRTAALSKKVIGLLDE